MNDKKICFILCVNNDMYLDECVYYINKLEIPTEYEIDIITVRDADSMTCKHQMLNTKYIFIKMYF